MKSLEEVKHLVESCFIKVYNESPSLIIGTQRIGIRSKLFYALEDTYSSLWKTFQDDLADNHFTSMFWVKEPISQPIYSEGHHSKERHFISRMTLLVWP